MVPICVSSGLLSIPINCVPLNGSFDYHRESQYEFNCKSPIDKALNEMHNGRKSNKEGIEMGLIY